MPQWHIAMSSLANFFWTLLYTEYNRNVELQHLLYTEQNFRKSKQKSDIQHKWNSLVHMLPHEYNKFECGRAAYPHDVMLSAVSVTFQHGQDSKISQLFLCLTLIYHLLHLSSLPLCHINNTHLCADFSAVIDFAFFTYVDSANWPMLLNEINYAARV